MMCAIVTVCEHDDGRNCSTEGETFLERLINCQLSIRILLSGLSQQLLNHCSDVNVLGPNTSEQSNEKRSGDSLLT
jgi:hypothetical protein